MEKTILIRNAKAIVTCDGEDHVYMGADMLVSGQKIVKIGVGLTDSADEILDATGKLLYPGLINTHHHFFQTFVRNLRTIDYPNMTVPEWLDQIYRIFQLVDDEVIYYSSLTAMADLVKHGCTCAFDHQYCYTKATGKTPVDRQMEAAKLLGIRYHAGRGTNTLPRSKGSTMPENMLETTDEFLQDCERLVGLYHDSAPFAMSRIVPAPCQPINCYRETFVETVDFCRKHGLRMHTHLGEGENEIMRERWGKRTLDWCGELGFVGDDVWIAHGWELTPEEYLVMAKTGTGVSHCPGPAVLGGFPILDIRAMQEAGVCVSLGCDGSSTNDSSSLLDSMRVAWMMQAFHSKSRGGCISPYEMLKIATVSGAKTLGRSELGSLEPGKAADLFMIDSTKLELTGTLHDPKNLLARTGVTGYTDLTMVGGKIVWQNGQLIGVDETELARRGEETCTRVLRQPCQAFHHLL
ncbi:MAG: amidohydrolase [Oscillospiraceae bacterium]